MGESRPSEVGAKRGNSFGKSFCVLPSNWPPSLNLNTEHPQRHTSWLMSVQEGWPDLPGGRVQIVKFKPGFFFRSLSASSQVLCWSFSGPFQGLLRPPSGKRTESGLTRILDERQITHLICARLKYDLYDFFTAVLGLLPALFLV